MTQCRSFVGIAVAITVMSGAVGAQKGPAAADVLQTVTSYLAAYGPHVSGVTLDEEYTLLDVSGGRILTTRRIGSDLVLLNVAGRVVGLRDAYAIDGNPLRERTPRIISLLAKPSQAAWDQAQAFANQTSVQMQEELVARLNDPTLALQFASPASQSRMNWRIDGRKKIAGIETVGLRFEEMKRTLSDYIVQTRGKAVGTGRLWVDPVTGAVFRTELSMQSNAEFARIAVDYSRDTALDLLLPGAMVDTYEAREVVGPGMSNMGAGSPGVARRSFDCRASYTNPRLTPIDLRVPREPRTTGRQQTVG